MGTQNEIHNNIAWIVNIPDVYNIHTYINTKHTHIITGSVYTHDMHMQSLLTLYTEFYTVYI